MRGAERLWRRDGGEDFRQAIEKEKWWRNDGGSGRQGGENRQQMRTRG